MKYELILENWRNFISKNNNDELNERKAMIKLKDVVIVPGLQPKDSNTGSNYLEIAEQELKAWKSEPINNQSANKTKNKYMWYRIAKYWAAIRRGFYAMAGGAATGKLYGPGKKNPAWSAAFIQYCMLKGKDPSWPKIQGKGQAAFGNKVKNTPSNHAWYWAGAFVNTLMLQDPKNTSKVSEDDWIFIPLDPAHGKFLGKKNEIKFIGSQVGYPKEQVGDIVLVTGLNPELHGGSGRKPGEYHGDIQTSSGRIGGNTSPQGGRVGPTQSNVMALMTKNSEVKNKIREILKLQGNEEQKKDQTAQKKSPTPGEDQSGLA